MYQISLKKLYNKRRIQLIAQYFEYRNSCILYGRSHFWTRSFSLWPKMATRRNMRHNYFSQDATAFTSRNLNSLISDLQKLHSSFTRSENSYQISHALSFYGNTIMEVLKHISNLCWHIIILFRHKWNVSQLQNLSDILFLEFEVVTYLPLAMLSCAFNLKKVKAPTSDKMERVLLFV